MINKKFNKLTILRDAPRGTCKQRKYWCKCDCGKEVIVRVDYLRCGHTKSCGCLVKEASARAHTTHGMCGTPEYKAWVAMKGRCYNENDAGFHWYGGRGIIVSSRWNNSFETFYAEMGKRPSAAHSLDRIDNSSGYQPGNCRWATQVQQCNNTRSNVNLSYKGETHTESEWAKLIGVQASLISQRLGRGWSIADTLSIESIKKGHTTLNDMAVKVIRYMHSKGMSVARLADAHGVNRRTIDKVISRETWGDVLCH